MEIFLWCVVVIDIVLMSSLLVIATGFLIQSCRAKQKTAKFIVKLLILVVCVSITGILNSVREAPWWRKNAYFTSVWDIVIKGAIEFIYWTAAQWSTWIIAFQFYSTAQQMKFVDEHFNSKYERRRNMTQ